MGMKLNKGITLFIAVVVAGVLLSVAMGIIEIAYREAVIAGSARESQYAFYAADSGAECALYWDIVGQGGQSIFATTSPSGQVVCNRAPTGPTRLANQWPINQPLTTHSFAIHFFPDPYCAYVTVTKNPNGSTQIESLGFNIGPSTNVNNCDATAPRRVQRAIRLTY